MLGTLGSSFLIRKGDLSRRSWPPWTAVIILADSVHICLFLFLLLVLFLGSCRDCSEICVVLFLKENVFPPLDVETNLGSTGAYKVPTRTQRFFNIPFGKLYVRSATVGIMLTLEPESQSASGKSTMLMEIGMTGCPGSPLWVVRPLLIPTLILLRTVVVVVVVVVVDVVYVLEHLRAVIAWVSSISSVFVLVDPSPSHGGVWEL